MKESLKVRIKKEAGPVHGEVLIPFLESFDIGDDVQFHEREISIPAKYIKDVEKFKKGLSDLSTEKFFPATMVGDRIHIDYCKHRPMIFRGITGEVERLERSLIGSPLDRIEMGFDWSAKPNYRKVERPKSPK